MNIEDLKIRRKQFLDPNEKLFFEIPDRWYEHPTWVCCNGHVSTIFLKSELKGDCCLVCMSSVILTDPMDEGFNEQL